jgi:hypothetical protein
MRITRIRSKEPKKAARARFDMIVFDASEKPLQQNIAETRRGVEAVKSIHSEILVRSRLRGRWFGNSREAA